MHSHLVLRVLAERVKGKGTRKPCHRQGSTGHADVAEGAVGEREPYSEQAGRNTIVNLCCLS